MTSFPDDKDLKALSFIPDEKDLEEVKIPLETSTALVCAQQAKDSQMLISEIAKRAQCSEKQAFILLSIICQKGGTAGKAQSNVYAIVDGIRLELGTVREIINSQKKKFTLRQFARTHATSIHKVADYFQIPGDLAKKIMRIEPNLRPDRLIWL